MADITVHRGLFSSVDLHVEDTGGSGRPVVLIHGWPLSGASWAHQVPAFAAAGYRVISYDRRGFGRSDKPGAATTTTPSPRTCTRSSSRSIYAMSPSLASRWVAARSRTTSASTALTASTAQCSLPRSRRSSLRATTTRTARCPRRSPTEWRTACRSDRDAFFPQFLHDFFTARGALKVSQAEVDAAVELAQQSDQKAALGAMEAFATTDFREDLKKVTVPTLVIHGDSDGIVPFEGSGARTHVAIPGSELVLIADAPHGVNVSNAEEWNAAVLTFLAK